MIDFLPLIAALTIGFLGGSHCVLMCGGIVSALSSALDQQHFARRLCLITAYNIGRMLSYCLIAWIFYQFIASIERYFTWQFMRWLSGVLLIAMGLYLAQWWQGLVYLEKVGGYLWRYIQPLSRHLLPVKSFPQALFLGALWGWLPCGLIYSALAYAATAPSATEAVLVMFFFALGTMPTMMLAGVIAERFMGFSRHRITRSVMGILLILFGLWTAFYSAGHSHKANQGDGLDDNQSITVPHHH